MRCGRGDFLHHDDGSHRTTCPTTKGRDLDRFDAALARHLARLGEES